MPQIEDATPAEAADVRARTEPLVIRGLAAEGRIFYAPGLAELGFRRDNGTLAGLFNRLAAAAGEARPPAIAAQAVIVGVTSNQLSYRPRGLCRLSSKEEARWTSAIAGHCRSSRNASRSTMSMRALPP